ncbi:plasmid stabilization protein [Methylobacterium radiotolerans]|jgi:plasmid stabilization system protein ParE|uniref:Plasmid stabilization system protein ParE n=1 Tax=Methylobacterium brachiatum TaxID=269660 RepID=A0AAJ1TUQ6_9HYPH|nr:MULTISPECIES: type II toxin-antitoxin system RelE/ParE family toxin [Methylobacterium]KIU26613.1 plasmid stabilization protein [Methylobacterium radiotolerans]MCB4806526.1 type II toxin-antitoxin system RelE/ParE family toxin [Methylobacterium brachiatum]MDE4916162.1 type II toxin-antitoxin system RelE/ParE family toxin [Methylobacterium sp. 092160098-2]MDQ0547582.1 plasmid stabilization system protein ParE [Methylobacterium brachiatum]MWV25139.1 type II toxin-antitoxin system RelE/ParE fam
MIVVFTEEAEVDLEHIANYIAEANPRRAVSFVDELVDCCQRLAEAPQGYPLVPRYRHSGVRRRSYGRYLVFYRVGADRIDILHVLHGAQDYEAILFPGD